MSQLKPIAVPLPFILLVSALIIACASDSSGEFGYYDDTSGCSSSGTGCTESYTPPYTQPYTPSEPTPSAPAEPTLPSYIPELDATKPPEYPKTADVSVQYSEPAIPSSENFFDDLSAKYSVASYRGDAGNPIYDDYYSIQNTTALLVAETSTRYNADGSSTIYAHGLAFATFDNSKRAPFPNTTVSAGDRFCLAYGFMRDGSFHGPWWFNYETHARAGNAGAQVEKIVEYQYGKAAGESRSYDANGYLTQRGYYSNGQPNGTFTFWNSDSTVQKEYVNGTAYGPYHAWDADGRLEFRTQIYGDTFYGKYEAWYHDDESLFYEVAYRDLGPDRGWSTFYNRLGKLHVQAWYEGAAAEGPWISYAPEGFKQWEGRRSAGVHHGVFKRFTADGSNDYDTEFSNGIQTGLVHTYYPGGKLWKAGQLVDGKNEGRFTAYREDGSISDVADYKDGQLHGAAIVYDAAGEVTSHDIYENGQWVRSDLAPGWPEPVPSYDEFGNEVKRDYGRWRVETQDEMPPMEVGMVMAWSEALGGCVMFGGQSDAGDDSSVCAETWLRKDGRWRRIFADGESPAARNLPAMTYDSKRGVVVLFGGDGHTGGLLNDTWELSNTGWTRLDVADPPAAHVGGRMAYDSARGVCVLFGGARDGSTANTPGFLDTTHEWDGQAWRRVDIVSPPAARWGHAMAYDEERALVVMQGGATAAGPISGTWVYDGKRWSESDIEEWVEIPGAQHAMVYDSHARQMVLLQNFGEDGPEKFEAHVPLDFWGDLIWNLVKAGSGKPARQEFAAAYDRATSEVVVFGGSATIEGKTQAYRETLVLTDVTQADLQADVRDFVDTGLSAPGWSWIDNGEFGADQQQSATFTQDVGRGVTVMFGGWDDASYLGQTREFADGKWTLMQPKDSPSARAGAVTWYDETRKTVMLMGGQGDPVIDDNATHHTDLWEWNGSNWKRLRESVPGMPSDISNSAYDIKRGVVVALASAVEGEKRALYEFNGTAWKRLEAGDPAENLAGGYWVYDPGAEKLLYYGAYNPQTFGSDERAWYWDGKYWEEVGPESPLSADRADYRLHADLAHKALWQVTTVSIRRLQDGKWTQWRCPEALLAWTGGLWLGAGSGHVFFHGTIMDFTTPRNDTLEFDPEQGEQIE